MERTRKRSSSREKGSHRKKRKKKISHTSSSHKRKYYESSDSDSSLDSDTSCSDSSASPQPKKRKQNKEKRYLSSKKKKKHKSEHKGEKFKKKKKKDAKVTAPKKIEPHNSPPHTGSLKTATQVKTDIKAVLAAQTSKVKGPMTKEEYERQQSVVRRVYDPDTGRYRLVKGDGEIIEEIVSREQQKAINKQATLGDGTSFQALTRKLL